MGCKKIIFLYFYFLVFKKFMTLINSNGIQLIKIDIHGVLSIECLRYTSFFKFLTLK
jgi:hypothetical protein